MKNKLKGLGSGILGIIIFIGVCLLISVLFVGYVKVVGFLFPVILILSVASVGLFLFIILPLSIFRSLRSKLSGLTMALSYIVGASVWIFSFLNIIYYLGWVAFFFMFMFHIVSPIAAIGLFFKGEWAGGLSIVIGIIFTYGMRFYSIWLAIAEAKRMEDQFSKQSDIIDVEAESEVIQDAPELIDSSSVNLEKTLDGEDVKYD